MSFCDTPYIGRICDVPSAVKSVWNWRAPVSAAGCSAPDESCLASGGLPEYTSPAGPVPELGYDISDPNRPAVTWQIFGIKDCDGSTGGITVEADFGIDGKETASLALSEDKSLTATISHKFNNKVGYPIKVTITGKNGKSIRVDIGPPGWSDPPVNVCDTYPKPKVLPGYTVNVDPSEALPGEPVFLSFPKIAVLRCDDTSAADGSLFSVSFILNNQEFPAGSSSDIFSKDIDTHGWSSGYYPIGIKVWDEENGEFLIPASAASGLVIRDPSSSYPPTATIGNLSYAYSVGDTQANIECYSDDPNASFAWTVTRPDGIIDSHAGYRIPSYTFDLLGDYDFKCIVTAAGGNSSEIRSVSVYPLGTDIPILSILGPNSAPVGTSVNFMVGSPDTGNYRYLFNFADGSGWTEGTDLDHTFSSTGSYGVVLKAELLSDPSTYFTLNSAHNITIY